MLCDSTFMKEIKIKFLFLSTNLASRVHYFVSNFNGGDHCETVCTVKPVFLLNVKHAWLNVPFLLYLLTFVLLAFQGTI